MSEKNTRCWMLECAQFTEGAGRKPMCGMYERKTFPVTDETPCPYEGDREPAHWYATYWYADVAESMTT